MVPNSSENVSKETTSFTTPPTSSIETPGSDTSINNEQNIKISGLNGFRPTLLEALILKHTQRGFPSLLQVPGDKAHHQVTLHPC